MAHRSTRSKEVKAATQERKRARREAAAEGAEAAEGEASEGRLEVEAGEAAPAAAPDGGQRQCQRRSPAPPAKGLPDWAEIRRSREPRVAQALAGSAGGEDAAAANKRKQRERQGPRRGIDPILPFVDAAALAAVVDFYGLPPGCPVPGALIARTTEARPKRLHYVSPAVKRLLQIDARQALNVTAAGVKVGGGGRRRAPRVPRLDAHCRPAGGRSLPPHTHTHTHLHPCAGARAPGEQRQPAGLRVPPGAGRRARHAALGG